MSVVDAPISAAADESADRGRRTGALDHVFEQWSERLNPILVKEARQALKSRQFVATFSLLLVAAWAWTLIGVSLLTPGVYFAPSGPFMLVGYFLVLAVPLLVVVPFSAFWSLAREREDQTFELVSITTLTARQIVTGKLGSAILQMLVYYSALAPCIAFTYLLRGIDAVVICLVLAGTFVLSVLLSLVGLSMAALTQTRHWQMLIAVLLLIGLVIVGIYWIVFTMAMLQQSLPMDSRDFWITLLALFTGAASFYVLLVRVAAGQISFASDNRSTPVRRAMLAQLALFVGWMGYAFFRSPDDDVLFMTLVFGAIVWALYGVFMCGETAQLSPRAKRRLPQSLLASSFFTWMNPGAETGYVFTVASFTALVIVVLAWGIWTAEFGDTSVSDEFFLFSTMLWGYFVLYMGLGRSIVAWLGRYMASGFFLSLAVHSILLVATSLGPTFFQAWLEGFDRLSYTSLQTPNWAWTLAEAADDGLNFHPEVPLMVLAAATAMLILRLGRAAAEVRHVRALVPQRVAEDDLARRVGSETPSFPATGDHNRGEQE
jgi:hypothetical protein